jgi:hypothetical protein
LLREHWAQCDWIRVHALQSGVVRSKRCCDGRGTRNAIERSRRGRAFACVKCVTFLHKTVLPSHLISHITSPLAHTAQNTDTQHAHPRDSTPKEPILNKTPKTIERHDTSTTTAAAAASSARAGPPPPAATPSDRHPSARGQGAPRPLLWRRISPPCASRASSASSRPS